MIFDRILEAIGDLDADGGAVSIADLSAVVGVEASALGPMLDRLVAGGLLDGSARARSVVCSGRCGRPCDPTSCAFVVRAPRWFSLDPPRAAGSATDG